MSDAVINDVDMLLFLTSFFRLSFLLSEIKSTVLMFFDDSIASRTCERASRNDIKSSTFEISFFGDFVSQSPKVVASNFMQIMCVRRGPQSAGFCFKASSADI